MILRVADKPQRRGRSARRSGECATLPSNTSRRQRHAWILLSRASDRRPGACSRPAIQSARAGAARHVWALAVALAALSLLPALGAVDPNQQLSFAKGLYERKLYSLAVPEFEKFLRSHPKHAGAATASYLLGHSYRGSGDWAKAATAYEAALRAYPKDPQADGALFSLGQCYLRLEQFDKAAATFTRQIETSKDPEALAQARYWLGEAEYQRKRYPQAEAAYRSLVQKHPTHQHVPYAYLSLGACAAERGDPEAAVAALRVLLERHPQFEALDEARVRLGDAFRALGRHREAREAYAGVSTRDAGLRLAAMLGSAYAALDAKDYRAVLAATAECATLSETASRERAETDLLAAGARYGLKEYPAALEAYERVVESQHADLAEEALYWSGNTLRAAGKPDEAVARYTAILTRFPKGAFAARARLRIGDCHADAGRSGDAAAAYRAVLEAHPNTDAAREAQAAIADLLRQAGAGDEETSQLLREVGQLPPGSIAADAQVQLAQKEFAAERHALGEGWPGSRRPKPPSRRSIYWERRVSRRATHPARSRRTPSSSSSTPRGSSWSRRSWSWRGPTSI